SSRASARRARRSSSSGTRTPTTHSSTTPGRRRSIARRPSSPGSAPSHSSGARSSPEGTHSGGVTPAPAAAIVPVDAAYRRVARAKATFTPRSRPFIGNAAAVLEPEAHVAAGAVFYVDGQGTVRRLHAGAPPATVTTFPFLTSQTEFSFAVSGDGTALAASGFTFPPQASPPPCDQPMACPFGAGP